MQIQRQMAPTAELVALVERTEPDPGPPPGMHIPSEDEMRATAAAFLANRPKGPLHLFAYGSDCRSVERRQGWCAELHHADH